MGVDTIVGDPERMNPVELGDTIRKVRAYEQKRGCQAGVVLIQRRQFGGLYEIVSKEKADQLMSRPVLNEPRTPEWGIRFYSRSELEGYLRKRLKSEQRGYS